MAYTYEELKNKTVVELREIASGIEHEAVQGYTQLSKEQLLPRLCQALGVDAHEHHVATGINKAQIKSTIRLLKARRDEAIQAKEYAQLKKIRRRIHRLKHRLRKAAL